MPTGPQTTMTPARLFGVMAIASFILAASAATPGLAHSVKFSAGEPGDPKKPARTIEIAMREEYGLQFYVPEKIVVKRGEQVRFILRNEGKHDHEFVLATEKDNLKHAAAMRKNPDMEHDDPNAVRLKPAKNGELIWKFTKRGTFEFSCLIPGHREDGMIGTVVVK